MFNLLRVNLLAIMKQLTFSTGLLFLMVVLTGKYIHAQDQERTRFKDDSLQVMTAFNIRQAAFRNHEGVVLFEAGQPEKALPLLDEACRLHPDYADAFYNRGVVQLALSRPAEALLDFAVAIQLDAKPAYYLGRGILQLERGDTVMAISDFQKVMQLDGSNIKAASCLGLIHLDRGSFPEAIDAFNQVLKTTSSSTIALNGRALAWLASGDTLRAIKDIESSLEADSGQVTLYRQMGHILLHQNRYGEAKEVYLAATGIDPEDVFSWNALAVISFYMKDNDTAMYYCNLATETDPGYGKAWNTKGNLFMLKEAYQQSEAFYSMALQLAPELYPVYYNRGVCREMLRDVAGACNDWQTAGENGISKAAEYFSLICE